MKPEEAHVTNDADNGTCRVALLKVAVESEPPADGVVVAELTTEIFYL